jgi:hypothetical protein
MFSMVDFAQPDGPTRMMNSPSAMGGLFLARGDELVEARLARAAVGCARTR